MILTRKFLRSQKRRNEREIIGVTTRTEKIESGYNADGSRFMKTRIVEEVEETYPPTKH